MVHGIENILQYLQQSWSELLFWAVRALEDDKTPQVSFVIGDCPT